MTSIEPINATASEIPAEGTLHRICFVQQVPSGEDVLLEFREPGSCKAVCLGRGIGESGVPPVNAASDGLEILTLPGPPKDHPTATDDLVKWVAAATPPGMGPPIAITIHGAQVIWGAARVAILAAPDRTLPFLLAVVDFCYYENELRKLEREVSEGWSLLEMDSPLAHSVTSSDPDRFEDIGQRMEQTLKRHMRLTRIVPHLYQPRPFLPLLANQLVERLREKAHVEVRHEALVSQLEVFERIYEMNSQRISDFKEAQKSHTLEWVIIVLLAAECLLLFIDVLWTLKM